MDIRLLAPAFLFLLGTLPLLWLFPRRLHDRGLGLLRSAVIALLVVALARPVGLADSNEEYQVLVWDGSPSTTHMSLAEATESFLDSLGPQTQPESSDRFQRPGSSVVCWSLTRCSCVVPRSKAVDE